MMDTNNDDDEDIIMQTRVNSRLNSLRNYEAKQQERLFNMYKNLNSKLKAQSPDLVDIQTSTKSFSSKPSSHNNNNNYNNNNNNNSNQNSNLTIVGSDFQEDNDSRSLRQSSEIEKEIHLASETTSVTPTPENFD
jgi:hypothetical protein